MGSISSDKQKYVRESIKKIVKKLSEKKYCREWLNFNYPDWEIKNPSESNIRKFQSAIVEKPISLD